MVGLRKDSWGPWKRSGGPRCTSKGESGYGCRDGDGDLHPLGTGVPRWGGRRGVETSRARPDENGTQESTTSTTGPIEDLRVWRGGATPRRTSPRP